LATLPELSATRVSRDRNTPSMERFSDGCGANG
jgi:hypothetical protein